MEVWGCGVGWGGAEGYMRGAVVVAWHILPVSDTPFFPRGLWEESNRATSGVSRWMAGGVDSGLAESPRGCMHVARTSMLVQIHLNSHEQMVFN